MLTMVVGGVLIGAAPAVATTTHDHPEPRVHESVKNHKKSDNDKFSNKAHQVQYCVVFLDQVIIDSRVVYSDRVKDSCRQQLWQENEGDENEIGKA
jgi:hypothetical protein